MLNAIGMGDLQLKLPNGSGKTTTIFKDAIHTPEMAFTLISISRLDKAGFSVTFNQGMCTIRNPKSKTIATIPNSDGLYKVVATKWSLKTKTVNTAMPKMSISEAHRKLGGHVACSAIEHVVLKGLIKGIDLDLNSKLNFSEVCTKAKLATQPFPKESET